MINIFLRDKKVKKYSNHILFLVSSLFFLILLLGSYIFRIYSKKLFNLLKFNYKCYVEMKTVQS